MFLRARALRLWGHVRTIADAFQSLPEDLHDKLIAIPIKAGENNKFTIYVPNGAILINLHTAHFREEGDTSEVTRVWAINDNAESFLIATPFEDVCNVLAHNVFDTTAE